MKHTTTYFWLFAAFLIISSCAVREAPKGGPEDKTPPAILGVDPAEGSILLPLDASFDVTFSKTMQHENTEGAIFLSPVFWGYPRFKWSGKKLTIVPPENLRGGTTYILTIGANATDIRGNKLGRSQSFAFSTGIAIDSGGISGAIFSTDGQHIAYDIWAYALGDSGAEGFYRRIPDYATQVDSIGGFKIEHLGNNSYLVVAVNDKNDDLFWDPSSEEIGLPPSILNITSGEQIEKIILRPARRDTATAYISKATPLSRQRIAVEFSQLPQKDRMLNPDLYRISYNNDSLLNFGPPYIGEGGALIFETDPQIAGRSYQLISHGLVSIWGVPFDSAGIRFTGIEMPDTVKATLQTIFPPNGSTSIYEDSLIEMTFSKGIRALTLPTAVTVMADSIDTLRFSPAWVTPNIVRLRFPARIPREKKINISLKADKMQDDFQNTMGDSILSFSFRLPPQDTVGSVTATLESGRVGNIIGILSNYSQEKGTYQSHLELAGGFNFSSVMPGIYRFELFADSDSNGEWSPGVISPFQPSERFLFIPDTVTVRSRWATDIGSVSLPILPR